MPKLKVRVDQELCTGEAVCTGISPRYYELITNDRGEHRAQVRDERGNLHVEYLLNVSDDDYDEILEAAERCPPKAIFIWEVDAQGRESQICP
jgi:ferredoxin